MIGGGAPPAVAGLVLLAVFVVGVLAGRAKRRVTLLVAGIVAVVVVGVVLTGGVPGRGSAAEISMLYAVALPLVVAYLAGWLCGRGTWFRRLIVVAAAALLLAAFPYAAAGQATADALAGAPAVPGR